MNELEKEALKYDLNSLIALQAKRLENIKIFEQSIKNERAAQQQEEGVETALEQKLLLHSSGLSKLSDADMELISADLPKLKSTKQKRLETIQLLKTAILEEQTCMDHEERMINYLKK
jgi:hypothetical protein